MSNLAIYAARPTFVNKRNASCARQQGREKFLSFAKLFTLLPFGLPKLIITRVLVFFLDTLRGY